MRRSRWLRALAMAGLLMAGGGYAIASIDWCGQWPLSEPTLQEKGMVEGELLAGAARVELVPPYPVVIAGHPPIRAEASRAVHPCSARALVLKVDGLTIGIVSVDLLTMPGPLVEALRGQVAVLGLSELWVGATHSHSSFGAYDRRLISALAGTGRHRDAAEAAVLGGAAQALREAAARLEPVTLWVGEGSAEGLVIPRSGGEVDQRLTRVVLRRGTSPLAQLVVFAAHPTLVPRTSPGLNPDWPGALSDAEEAAGAGVTLVLQGAVGNASVIDVEAGPSGLAAKLEQAGASLKLAPIETPVRLGFARASVSLPRPDCSRLIPWYGRAAVENVFCASSARLVEVAALRVGPVELLGVPGEPTLAAGRQLERGSGAQRTVALVNGYLGYFETAELAAQYDGESSRMFYGAQLVDRLEQASALAGAALHFH